MHSNKLIPGCLAVVDDLVLRGDVRKYVPVWNKVTLNVGDSFQEKNFMQVDQVQPSEVVMVIKVENNEEVVHVLTNRGIRGAAYLWNFRRVL